jgi:hypothetical protein
MESSQSLGHDVLTARFPWLNTVLQAELSFKRDRTLSPWSQFTEDNFNELAQRFQ